MTFPHSVGNNRDIPSDGGISLIEIILVMAVLALGIVLIPNNQWDGAGSQYETKTLEQERSIEAVLSGKVMIETGADLKIYAPNGGVYTHE